MKNTQNTNTQNVTLTAEQIAEMQNKIDAIFVKYLGRKVNLRVEVMELVYGEKLIKFLDFTDLTNDAHIIALPALGVNGQERVHAVSKGDSLKAKYRVSNLNLKKIKSAIMEACRNIPWNVFIDIVATMQKYVYVKGEDGKRVKDGTTARYKTVRSTDKDLHFMEGYTFKTINAYLKGVAYSDKAKQTAEQKAEADLAKARKAFEDAQKKLAELEKKSA